MKKTRLDNALVELGMAPNLKIAQSIIMQGLVHNSNKLLTKPGLLIAMDEEIYVKQRKSHNFVSRGGVKLSNALKSFNVDVEGKVCLDIGCSTGGFTEILLDRRARHIFAVDVAYGEFDYGLRNSNNVTLYERTNARYLTKEQIYLDLDLVVCDVSFISLKLVLPKAIELSKSKAEFLVLIKPQFEAPQGSVIKGIVKDPNIWEEVCKDIRGWFEEQNFDIKGIVPSSILGAKGNKEFFIYAIRK